MNCKKCNIELLEGSKFCDKCGAPQDNCSAKSAAPQDNCSAKNVKTGTLKCVKCNIELLEGSKFCDKCGVPQNSANAVLPAAAPQSVSNMTAAPVQNDISAMPGQKSRTALIVVGAAVAVIVVLLLSLNHIVYGIGCCFRDIDAIRSYDKANAMFIRAAKMGNANAMYEVGFRHEIYKEMADAVEWYKAAAENDHVEAQLKLGRIYLNGFGTPEQAFDMFNMALENDEDNTRAQYEVAYCKLFGIGTSKDAKLAFELFKNIDEDGENGFFRDSAQVYLAHCYLNGEGVAKDVAKALEYIRRGLEKNDPLASFLMADCLFRGNGVAQNYFEAAKFAKNAAVNGIVKAQILLNECFKQGNFSWNSTQELQEYAAKLKMTVDDKRHLVKNNGYKPAVIIPYGVVAIEARAFSNANMRHVVISDTVELIQSYAFSECNNLQEVVIPASVKKMDNAVFAWCENLKKVTVAGDDIDFRIDSIVGGDAAVSGDVKLKNLKEVWISPRAGFDGNTLNLVKLLPLTERQKQGYDLCRVNSQGELLPVNRLHKTVIVPDGVVNLGCGFHHDDYLCRECRNRHCKSSCYMRYRNPTPKKCQHDHRSWDKYFGSIETVVLPESVEDLGGGFANFASLKQINIPGKVKEIPPYAFVDSSIEKITLPKGIKKIGEAAFQNCDNLREITIPEGVTVIPENAFIACDRLKKVVIPDSVKRIEKGAFNGCPLLKTLEVPAVTTVVEGKADAYKVHGGGSGEFSPRYKVIRRKNADTAQGIGLCSLSDDGKTLVSVQLKDITRCVIPEGVRVIGEKAFKDCKYLQEVIIPKSVRIIDRWAFENCIRLQSISLPEGVQIIKWGAFKGCENLRNVNIPDSITLIEQYAFENCIRLKSLEVPLGVGIGGDLNGIYNYKEIELKGRLSAAQKEGFNLCRIGDGNVVYGVLNQELEKCIIPNKVTGISKNAFENCFKLKYVKIPASVTSIGRNAFRNCTSLESIEIPANVLNIESGTFANCNQLKHVVIPRGIIGIDTNAFQNCLNLKEVEVPASVNISDNAFPVTCKIIRRQPGYTAQKTGMQISRKKTEVPAKNVSKAEAAPAARPAARPAVSRPAADITAGPGDYSLSDDGKTFVSVKRQSITKCAIPESVRIIGKRAFYNCQNLQEVSIPQNVEEIGRFAFGKCSSLKKINIPALVAVIETGAFIGCQSLEEIELPAGVRAIAPGAFAYCTNLRQIFIPDSIRVISPKAFEHCTSLKEVRVPAKTRIGKNAFPDTCKIIRD